ncbi:MAG: ribosomal protein [Candidatus Doudnabacteria bacterium]|nr:ribosomal protein [Candidatus Doudnabacteria bacterium]
MPTTTKKTPTTKKPAAPKKTKAAAAVVEKQSAVEAEAFIPVPALSEKTEKVLAVGELKLENGRYAYSVGRRKTSIANVRLFAGKGKSMVNDKEILAYFGNKALVERAYKPLALTGLEGHAHIVVVINGGGLNSQSEAISHGIATAMVKNNEEFRKVLKKNGTLTRDSRMKERKKPGLKGARRGSQWAKR